jgi:hypothetical protein
MRGVQYIEDLDERVSAIGPCFTCSKVTHCTGGCRVSCCECFVAWRAFKRRFSRLLERVGVVLLSGRCSCVVREGFPEMLVAVGRMGGRKVRTGGYRLTCKARRSMRRVRLLLVRLRGWQALSCCCSLMCVFPRSRCGSCFSTRHHRRVGGVDARGTGVVKFGIVSGASTIAA